VLPQGAAARRWGTTSLCYGAVG